jgi:hypothetical protein
MTYYPPSEPPCVFIFNKHSNFIILSRVYTTSNIPRVYVLKQGTRKYFGDMLYQSDGIF